MNSYSKKSDDIFLPSTHLANFPPASSNNPTTPFDLSQIISNTHPPKKQNPQIQPNKITSIQSKSQQINNQLPISDLDFNIEEQFVQDNEEIFYDESQLSDVNSYSSSRSNHSKRFKISKKNKKQKQRRRNNENLRDKKRKRRTSVNQEKVKMMEYLFPFFAKGIPYKGTVLTLKDISKLVNLGYSTILHKYKTYRRKGVVEKGLLLKCKDFKRKYNKSIAIENFIKQALKQKSFKTAKDLANHIAQKYKVNANRSIISRHLNQMQRQKYQFLGEQEVQDLKLDEVKQQCQKNVQKQSHFFRIFLGLKNQLCSFEYLNLVQLYFQNGKLSSLQTELKEDTQIINLFIHSTETQLIDFYCDICKNQVNSIFYRNVSLQSAYKILYHQLETRINFLNMYLEKEDTKKLIVFPFSDTSLQFEQRRRLCSNVEISRGNVVIMPAKLQYKKLNFIKEWFKREVLPSIQKMKFKDRDEMDQVLTKMMREKQKSVGKYACNMYQRMNRLQR